MYSVSECLLHVCSHLVCCMNDMLVHNNVRKYTPVCVVSTLPTPYPPPLPSLSFLPLPRYRLLLQDLLRHTKETHPDYGRLKGRKCIIGTSVCR